MQIYKFDFKSAPIFMIDNFLPNNQAQFVLQEWTLFQPQYSLALVYDAENINEIKIDKTHRTNTFLNYDPHNLTSLKLIEAKIMSDECTQIWRDGFSIYGVINYTTKRDAVISRYGNGEFYTEHRDTRSDDENLRIITLIYYVNKIPKQFEGGHLIIREGIEHEIRVEPVHNRLVVFPSYMMHEVEKVSMTSDNWEDARFSLNYWVGFDSKIERSAPCQ